MGMANQEALLASWLTMPHFAVGTLRIRRGLPTRFKLPMSFHEKEIHVH
jgi:hypothetical protein